MRASVSNAMHWQELPQIVCKQLTSSSRLLRDNPKNDQGRPKSGGPSAPKWHDLSWQNCGQTSWPSVILPLAFYCFCLKHSQKGIGLILLWQFEMRTKPGNLPKRSRQTIQNLLELTPCLEATHLSSWAEGWPIIRHMIRTRRTVCDNAMMVLQSSSLQFDLSQFNLWFPKFSWAYTDTM